MQLPAESIGLSQEFDMGPILEANANSGLDFFPKAPITVTSDSLNVTVGVYEGPVPPVDANLLSNWNIAKGLANPNTGTTPTDAEVAALMFTVKAAAAGSANLTIAGGDIPDATDAMAITVVDDEHAPDHLIGDIVGNLRKQAAPVAPPVTP